MPQVLFYWSILVAYRWLEVHKLTGQRQYSLATWSLQCIFCICIIDVKKTFLNVFFTFLPRFYGFNVLKIFSNVFFLKTCIEMPIMNFEKRFWNHENELIGHSDGSLLNYFRCII